MYNSRINFKKKIKIGSVTLCITYISKATTAKERTTFIAINALVSTIGFIVGPGYNCFCQTLFHIYWVLNSRSTIMPLKAVQSALIPLGTSNQRWNMYTAAGWLTASMTLVQVILFFPCIFQEFNMAEKEAQWNQMKKQKTAAVQRTNNQGKLSRLFCSISLSQGTSN